MKVMPNGDVLRFSRRVSVGPALDTLDTTPFPSATRLEVGSPNFLAQNQTT